MERPVSLWPGLPVGSKCSPTSSSPSTSALLPLQQLQQLLLPLPRPANRGLEQQLLLAWVLCPPLLSSLSWLSVEKALTDEPSEPKLLQLLSPSIVGGLVRVVASIGQGGRAILEHNFLVGQTASHPKPASSGNPLTWSVRLMKNNACPRLL